MICRFVKHVGKRGWHSSQTSSTICVAKVLQIFVILKIFVIRKEMTVNGWIPSQIFASVKILDMLLKDSPHERAGARVPSCEKVDLE